MAHSLLPLLSFLLLTLIAPTSHATNFTATFFFGDSLVDTGNNNFLPLFVKADHPPYGRDFPGQTPTGRFTNGLMMPDLLSAQLGIKQLSPPFLNPRLTDDDVKTGVNFASAGAGYDDMTSAVSRTVPVSRQLRMFDEYVGRLKGIVGEEGVNRTLGDGLMVFSSGSNDIAAYFLSPIGRRQQFDMNGYQDFLLGILEGALKQLYDRGGRKFIVAGLPPINCMPAANRLRNPGRCILEQVSVATTYNSKLQNLLPKIQQSLLGSKIAYLDLHDNLLDMINNPTKYGFVESRRGCCGTGLFEIGPQCNSRVPVCPDATKYVFFDAVHPTDSVYKLVTQQIMDSIIPQMQ